MTELTIVLDTSHRCIYRRPNLVSKGEKATLLCLAGIVYLVSSKGLRQLLKLQMLATRLAFDMCLRSKQGLTWATEGFAHLLCRSIQEY